MHAGVPTQSAAAAWLARNGALIAIIVAGVVFVALASLLGRYCWHRRRQQGGMLRERFVCEGNAHFAVSRGFSEHKCKPMAGGALMRRQKSHCVSCSRTSACRSPGVTSANLQQMFESMPKFLNVEYKPRYTATPSQKGFLMSC